MDAAGDGFVEPFMTAPSPGIIAAARQNAWYDTDDAYLAALGKALQIEYETIVRHGYLLQIDAPDLRAGAAYFLPGPARSPISWTSPNAWSQRSTRRSSNIPRDRVRMHVCWGNYEAPHDCDVALHEILPPAIQQAKVGGFVLPFREPTACA